MERVIKERYRQVKRAVTAAQNWLTRQMDRRAAQQSVSSPDDVAHLDAMLAFPNHEGA